MLPIEMHGYLKVDTTNMTNSDRDTSCLSLTQVAGLKYLKSGNPFNWICFKPRGKPTSLKNMSIVPNSE